MQRGSAGSCTATDSRSTSSTAAIMAPGSSSPSSSRRSGAHGSAPTSLPRSTRGSTPNAVAQPMGVATTPTHHVSPSGRFSIGWSSGPSRNPVRARCTSPLPLRATCAIGAPSTSPSTADPVGATRSAGARSRPRAYQMLATYRPSGPVGSCVT